MSMESRIEFIFSDLTDKASRLNDRVDGKFFQSLENDHIKYSHISHIGQLLHQDVSKYDTLIVRDGDTPFTDKLADTYLRHFNRIFCQNKCTNMDGVFAIPIGMEASDYIKTFDKFDIIKETRRVFCGAPQLELYGNFSISTSARKRIQCLNNFLDKPYFTNKVTNRLPHPSYLPQQQYLDFCNDVLNSKFILCPEGNGIDTHRFWETIYLGRIPVVLHNPVVDSFNVPKLVLNDWTEFEAESKRFIEEYDENKFDYTPLTFDYWVKRICGDAQ